MLTEHDLGRVIDRLLDTTLHMSQVLQELRVTPEELAEWSRRPRVREALDALTALWRLRTDLLAAEGSSDAMLTMIELAKCAERHSPELARRAAAAILKHQPSTQPAAQPPQPVPPSPTPPPPSSPTLPPRQKQAPGGGLAGHTKNSPPSNPESPSSSSAGCGASSPASFAAPSSPTPTLKPRGTGLQPVPTSPSPSPSVPSSLPPTPHPPTHHPLKPPPASANLSPNPAATNPFPSIPRPPPCIPTAIAHHKPMHAPCRSYPAPLALLAAALVGSAACSVAVAAPSFTLSGLPSSAVSGGIAGLSADGRSAAGDSNGLGSRGFLWTEDGGRNDFGLSIAAQTDSRGISGDGLTVVGMSEGIGSPHAFSWTQASGYRDLGVMPGYSQSEAVDANHDGSIIVGTLDNGTGTPRQAFRWTASGGMQGLGNNTVAHAISGNGNVIVGELGTTPRAFAWTQAGGLQFLSSIDGTASAAALATNTSGNIIAGISGQFLLPTLWIDGSPMQMLGELFSPRGVSDNGQVVVGMTISSVGRAAIWTPATGTIRLEDYLTANGVVVPANVDLGSCIGVSSDGLTFAGTIGNGELPRQGWVATIPPPCPADLDNDGLFSNGPTRDHAVTIDDLLFFLTHFEAGC